jgi:signal transduction histidine kinase
LTTVATAITEGDLSQQIPVEDMSDDEIGILAHAFSDMTGKLAHLLDEREATIVKLREVDLAKSQFITMMSHELRTPLHAVNGFAELLLLGMSGELSETAKADVQLIYDNGQHLLELINDILDISQIEAGHIQIVPELLNVAEFVENVLAVSKPLAKESSLELLVDIPDSLPPIYADQTRLKQILLNLVSNAIKFTSKGSVTIKVDVRDGRAYFAVIDTGVGIPLEKQSAIFEKFEQADMSDARQYGGTGLGLAICKQLVEMHGGEIGVKSKIGVGSEFWFTIPDSTEKRLTTDS